MADLRPFRALRPRVDLAARVSAPPYDVVDTAQARALADGNPDSFLRISRPEINLPGGANPDSDEVHEAGRAALNNLVARGVLNLDPTPTYSVYRQIRGAQTQTGLVALASVADYVDGTIKVHEFTRPDKENDRVNHLEGLSAHDEPVFLLSAPGEPAWQPIQEIMAAVTARDPLVDITTEDGVGHVLWRIDDPLEVEEIAKTLTKVPQLYVADGHHRSAAAARVAQAHNGSGDTDAFPAVVFSGDELQIMPYHRVVADLAGRDAQQWINDLSSVMHITPIGPGGSADIQAQAEPPSKYQWGMYVAGHWYRIALLQGIVDDVRLADPVAGLDVSLLQDLVLAPGLGIADPRTDTRIAFVGGVHGLAELELQVDSGRYAVAFAMHPTSVADLVAVAGTGRVMPPKSTWFEPKLRSGLFVHRFSG